MSAQSVEYRFIEPLDVLYLRGNRLFEGAGAHGEALMPPWPSLAAGALRSRMLADAGENLSAPAEGRTPSDPELATSLGTPAAPGSFRVRVFTLAQRQENAILPCFPLPADVVVTEEGGRQEHAYVIPCPMQDLAGVTTSFPLPMLPVLRQGLAGKPSGGYWLNAEGLRAYLHGKPIERAHLTLRSTLWQTDPRLGIAMNPELGRAADGMLYTAETVALNRADPDTGALDTGFLVGVSGAGSRLPESGLLRLGGDGRGAAVHRCKPRLDLPDPEQVAADGRLRLVLATPGLFPEGWKLPGLTHDGQWHGPAGLRARLVSACVPRGDLVSGWDLAAGRPKTAQRVVPAGAVYHLVLEGGSADGLRTLLDEGLWPLIPDPDGQRRAEGFNNIWVAAWPR